MAAEDSPRPEPYLQCLQSYDLTSSLILERFLALIQPLSIPFEKYLGYRLNFSITDFAIQVVHVNPKPLNGFKSNSKNPNME